MLVSFSAALQGGLSFGSEVTRKKEVAESDSIKLAGKLELNKLFSSLFQASVEGAGQESNETKDLEVRKEAKAHTEASIAIILYDQLRQSAGYLVQPKSAADFASLEPGALVELHGTMLKNPVDAVVDYIDAVNILSGLVGAPDQQKGRQPKSHHGKDRLIVSGDPTLLRIRDALDLDRKRTPISNAYLRCSQPAGMSAVITLRTQNLRDLTLSELHKNTVRVVGKVTRAVGEGQTMSAFENYGMAMLPPEQLEILFTSLASNHALAVEFSDRVVQGPAVQVLPLMVFV
jgi:hypothetical protein